MSYQIGIDLGTTFSAVAYVDETGKPNMIRNRDNSTTIPSVIYFDGGTPIVGEEAKERQAFGETEIASFFKRSMGEDNFIQYFGDEVYTATDLSAIILKQLKQIAEDHLKTTITDAVITVPAYFENKQREETIEAGRKAGLNVKAIINEPTAAALAYGIKQTVNQNLIVYDLGGGTFDVTVVEVTADEIKVLATGGDHSLGGKDFDDRIIAYVAELFEEKHGIDPLNNLDTMNDLLVKGENAKKMLTSRTSTHLSIVCEGIKETYMITRDLFGELTDDLVERTWSLTNNTLQEANLSWRHITDVLLVGGSTRMPMVHDYIYKAIGKPPLEGVNPDEAVAIGAAIKANLPEENASSKPIFSLGATKSVTDVMSHSLGMVAINDDKTRYINSHILYKNEPIPVKRKKDYQIRTGPNINNMLEIYVTQGESKKPYECSIIGKYTVENIAHQKSGFASIEVSYAYDANGVIQVSAFDKIEGVTLPVERAEVNEDLSWLYEAPKDEEVEIEIKPDLSVLIAVDLSGSMDGTPLKEAQAAATEFINKMDLSHTSIGLIGFANKAELIVPLIDDYDQLQHSVSSYTDVYNNGHLGYGTNSEPFTVAKDVLKDRDGLKFIIVLTDGYWGNQHYAISEAKWCHEQDIDVIAIGFGQADERFLEKIASTSENALFTDVSKLVSSFSKIAQELNHSSLQIGSQKQKSGFLRIFK